MLKRELLTKLYLEDKFSLSEIAMRYNCSISQINYWMQQYDISRRKRADATYIKRNPSGDPFCFRKPNTIQDALLFGIGIGLYWGEGNKRNKNTVRLGNTDPRLIKKFISFLRNIFCIKEEKLRFGLQIFSDMNPDDALEFWTKELNVSKDKFQKVIVTPARGVGTYRHKIQYGVVTIYYCNIKLRNILCNIIRDLPL